MYNVIAITKTHKLQASHSKPLAPNEIACANMLSKGAINDHNFLFKLYKALANLPIARAPLTNTFLAPIILVVIIPAIDIAIADNPTMFSFAHFLKHCNLDISSSCCSLISSNFISLMVKSLAFCKPIILTSNSMNFSGLSALSLSSYVLFIVS